MFHLSSDGTTTQVPISNRIDINTLSIQSLSPKYIGETTIYCVDPTINLFLIVHHQNSLKSRIEKTLPLNQCLKSLWKESPFVGDVLVVKTDDFDKIDINTIWTPDILRQYDLQIGKKYSFIR